ncbi:hypothetical protein PCASD_19972 [Puccinia coronata f. sp. avenae]|uniref:Uncharacterized protein n=1 Tax=Puccinia coronata f. sp. avenae TaxID=200324 RepID=A0A2N5SIH5_9BASI|nr:hypothetical protein PCASD_19972 [Puccinia coronata f. sp. avenae]
MLPSTAEGQIMCSMQDWRLPLQLLTNTVDPLQQPCSTGVRTDTVRPKREPTGRTDLSDRSRLVLCNRSQELIGQACPTLRQVLRSDSACPITGRTRLFEHRSNCRVRPVNAGSADEEDEATREAQEAERADQVWASMEGLYDKEDPPTPPMLGFS